MREVAYPKAILKKADKLSKTTGTLQVMGTVSEIGSTGIDVKIDYAVYTFLADNGEAYSGMFYIQDSEVFRIGDCVTINYNRENPKENVCIDRLDYEKKEIIRWYHVILFGNIITIGIFFVAFLL